jgi:hypothetical protein
MKIETIVNYGVPDEDKALLADIKGHREQELEEIYTALFAKMIQISPEIRRTALYIHEDDPYLLEMFIDTSQGGMLIIMNEAITYAKHPNDKLNDCVLAGNYSDDRRDFLGHWRNNRDTTITPRNGAAVIDGLQNFNRWTPAQLVGDMQFYVGPYGLVLPAPLTDLKKSDALRGFKLLSTAHNRVFANTVSESMANCLNRRLDGVSYNFATFEDEVRAEDNQSNKKTILSSISTKSARGLVYERDHSALEGFDVAVLYECDLGSINSRFNRIHRSAPSGWLELHVQTESNKLRHGFRVNNEPDYGPQDTRPTRGTITPIYKRKGDFSLAGKIDYKTWYETVRSKENARHTETRNRVRRRLGLEVDLRNLLPNWDREIIGLTNSGQIVFGYARKAPDETYEYALLKLGHSKRFESENLVGLTTLADDGPRPESVEVQETEIIQQVEDEPQSEEPLEVAENPKWSEEDVRTWLEAARKYATDRNQTLDETSIKSIFTAYVNSGAKVTEDDLKDFSRLNG